MQQLLCTKCHRFQARSIQIFLHCAKRLVRVLVMPWSSSSSLLFMGGLYFFCMDDIGRFPREVCIFESGL